MGSKPKQVTAPDPTKTAESQAGFNRDAAVAQQRLNQVNQVTPFGNLNFSQTGTASDGTPQFTATTTLSPAEQSILNANQGVRQLAGNQAQDFLSSNVINPESNANAIEGRLFELGRRRLDPLLAERESALRQTLANQGINVGTEAYDRELRNFRQGANDATNELLLSGRSQAFNEAQAEAQNPFNRFLQLAQLGQPGTPQFQSVPQASIAAPNFQAAQSDALAIQQGNADRENQRRMSLYGGLGQIGASLALSPLTGGLSLGGIGGASTAGSILGRAGRL